MKGRIIARSIRSVRCPDCGQQGSCNSFGDITDSSMSQYHPHISQLQSHICRRKGSLIMRPGAMPIEQLATMKITLEYSTKEMHR